MQKQIIIDSRMRKVEKEYLRSSGYKIIEIPTNNLVYPEISSHVDIFCSKIDDNIFLEPTVFNHFKNKSYNLKNLICGKKQVIGKYPLDIPYNICQIGKNIIHNFKYTDDKILEYIIKNNLNKIDIKQGYSNCSIAVISENSAIVSDRNIARILEKNNINVLLLDKSLDIKLLKNNNSYSKMNGFIGGCMARIGSKIIVFGDLEKIEEGNPIRDFIKKQKIELIEFKGYDLIDYGGIIIP